MKFHPNELIPSAYTIGGFHGRLTLEERAAAAAEAGFKKIGMTDGQYEAELAAGRSDREIRATLDRHGIHCAEIEFLYGWAGTGDGPGFPGMGKVDWRERLELLLRLADVVGAHHLNCGEVGFYGPLRPIPEVAEQFAGICDRAAEHNLVCVLEFFAWGELRDAATAWAIVQRANRGNAGILVDAWHFFRGVPNLQQLRAIPGEAIKLVQLCDGGPPEGELPADTTSRRRLPGDGSFDLVGLLGAIKDIGANPPFAIEIMSDELKKLPAVEQAKKARESTIRVLRSAGIGA
jgi:sugar phosphate isomerase/epimerase